MSNPTLRDEAVHVCGDASRVQCIFDYIFIDRQTAEQTLKLDKEEHVSSGELGMCLRNKADRLVISIDSVNR